MPQELKAKKIIDGPGYERFVVQSNIFLSRRDRMCSAYFTLGEGNRIEVNITGLTKHPDVSSLGTFFFTGEYYSKEKVGPNNRSYLVGSYNPTTKGGYCHIFSREEILENPMASLMMGFTMEQPGS